MIKLTNPNRSIEVGVDTYGFRTDRMKPGEIGKSTGQGADRKPFAWGCAHSLASFEVGAIVITSLTSDYYSDWECFEVAENPHYSKQDPQSHQQLNSFDDFNILRHGAE